ncbi:hypothetical protein BP6252_06053 [Coleophoma cylindrospora]|uniref:Uncharacterized protein n=1 Tax=Coleophoma cylindrospora TaxID=1849047 RepID=A0A3D8RM86_9HELO|nr:hypothetical protein BP6252_06053 [Coleophoma cylindrospora]
MSAAMKATYHLPPNFSTPPPPTGPFHLGTVVRNFERREQMRPLNQTAASRLPIPADQIYLDHKGGFEATRARLKSGELGVWAQFVGIDGIGAETSIAGESSTSDTYKFESVDTEYFFPSSTYIAQCLELSNVHDYLEGSNYKNPVFLVTGLKVAKGASVRREHGAKKSANLTIGLNNPGGTNIQAGPRVAGTVENSAAYSFTESSDFVVGIQCLKLYFKSNWFGGEKKLKEELFTTGATFVDDERDGQLQNLDNYTIMSPEDVSLPGYVCRIERDVHETKEETWIVPE